MPTAKNIRRLRSLKRGKVSFMVTMLEPVNPDMDDFAVNVFSRLSEAGLFPVSVQLIGRNSDLEALFKRAGYPQQ